MKKILIVLLIAVLLLLSANFLITRDGILSNADVYNGTMTNSISNSNKGTQEYNNLIKNLASFPVSFVYDETAYRGFGHDFSLSSKFTETSENKIQNDYVFIHSDKKLGVTLKTAVYPEYGAYEWTVYFSAVSQDNTAVLEKIIAADIDVKGAKPILKGINGDYGYLYSPYEYDLSKESKSFISTTGRPSHYTFPYYNLETDEGGVMLAIGWPGTYSVDFSKVKDDTTHIEATGTVGMKTYLKEGETVRTPLMAFVVYESRDEDIATNAWRKWYINCNQPKEHGSQMLGKTTVCLPFDCNGDKSIKTLDSAIIKTMQKMYANGFKPDVLWIDASWYPAVNGSSLTYLSNSQEYVSDWYKTGNWTIDKKQWSLFSDITDLLRDNNGNTMVWFEPERIGTDSIVQLKNLGIDPNWLIMRNYRDQTLFNLGNDDALKYMFNKICSVIDECGIDYYREDFNFDPAENWSIGDALQGCNRQGITENLHVQGHLKLWDMLLERYPDMIIDSCASGGGRNDLETMRRAVPYHRTDSEEFNTANTSISMNSTLFKWLPYFGSAAYDRNTWGTIEEYNSRAGYSGLYKMVFLFYTAEEDFYSSVKEYVAEYYKFAEYLYGDYYLLTEWHAAVDTSGWTAWEFFDNDQEKGVIQLFRQDNCESSSYTAKLKGLDPNAYYKLYRFDGSILQEKVKGRFLMDEGYRFSLNNKRESDVVFIEKV